ncbi:MAG: 50S ribosomal protein L11 methyltransferase [Proteobacteria bacterium]|nr:50S ribosomal protein L11 methyltransferase [Pseudomonadota bacterium]
MSWLQLSINTTKENAVMAEDTLFTASAQTVTLTDAADQPILEPGVNEVPVWNEVVITGLFDDPFCETSARQALLESIEQALEDIDHSCHTEILEDQNWTRAWMDHFHAMQFGERLWICPLHIDPPEPTAVNLRLDPGLAFGTGTHPTTSLCLRWLDQNIPAESQAEISILDYGCGSGILAIAACMLGAGHADGVDIDPQALTATHDNAKANAVNDRIESFLPEDYQQQHTRAQYDIVVANILSGPLAELAPMLAGHTKQNGDIVLSGILKEQAQTVIDTYSEFFEMDKPEFEEEWVLLHGIKR